MECMEVYKLFASWLLVILKLFDHEPIVCVTLEHWFVSLDVIYALNLVSTEDLPWGIGFDKFKGRVILSQERN